MDSERKNGLEKKKAVGRYFTLDIDNCNLY